LWECLVALNDHRLERKDLGRGDVAGPTDKPPTVAADYTGQVMVIQHPSAITVGYTPVIHAHTAQVACRFDKILQKIDQRSGQVIEKPMVIESYKTFPQLGRFAVRDMGMTVAVGIVQKVTKRKAGKKEKE
jgi:elongation factor 1-alpha